MNPLANRIKKLEKSANNSSKLLDYDCCQLLHIPVNAKITQSELQKIYNKISIDSSSSVKNAIKNKILISNSTEDFMINNDI